MSEDKTTNLDTRDDTEVNLDEEKDAESEEKSEEKIDDYKGMYLRALADYQNLLKQTARDKEEFCKYANVGLLNAILPVYDNLKLALEHADSENKGSWLEGVKHVVKQFKDALVENGLTEIEPLGQDFDYMTMEALSKEPAQDEKLDHKVAKVVKPGYLLNGKVIVHAKVVIFEYKK